MKTIFLNGDSQTCGTGDVINPKLGQHSYAEWLSYKINYTIVDNPAIGGASNDRIFRTTEEFLWECERGIREWPDFILLGWTECTRMDWWWEGRMVTLGEATLREFDDYNIITHQGLDVGDALERWPERVEYTNKVLTSVKSIEGLIHYNFNRMYNLHCRLEYHRVPHLFLHAHLGLIDNVAMQLRNYNPNLEYDLFEVFWDDCFWNVYNYDEASFVSWAQNKGYELTDGYHVSHDAHIEFADVLYDYIQTHNLLNKYR